MASKRGNGEGSIYYEQTHDRWATSITIGRDPATGKLIRRYAYGKTKADVTAKKQAMLIKYKDTYYLDADKITVGDWVDKYLTTYKQGSIRRNTYESYTNIAKIYLKPTIGNIVMDKLLPIQVQTAVNQIAAAKSPRTAAYMLSVLKMAIARALEEGLINRDPCRGIKKPYTPKRDIKTITPNEAQKLVDYAYSETMQIAIKIMYATGMRTEELLGLTWTKFDAVKNSLSIDQVIINTSDGPQIDKPKTKSSTRTISIPAKLTADLKAYRKLQAAQILSTPGYNNSNYIICRTIGLPILPRDYGKMFARVAKAADIDITAHGIRHTHATQLFAAGWHAKDVQERLGHSSVTITLDTYTHYIPSRQTDIANYLDQIYPNNPANLP